MADVGASSNAKLKTMVDISNTYGDELAIRLSWNTEGDLFSHIASFWAHHLQYDTTIRVSELKYFAIVNKYFKQLKVYFQTEDCS